MYGIADADHSDVALADLPGAFELHAKLGRPDELRARDPRGLLGDLLVAALRHVERAAGDVLVVRIGALVHRVAGDRRNGAALRRVHRGDLDGIGAHFAQHRLLAAVGLRAERRAFEDLAEVVRLVFRKAVMDRGRREHAAVAAAAADDDVRTLLQQRDEGMDAGHRDDSLGRIELRFGERRVTLEPGDLLARAHPAAQVFLARLPNRSSRA